MTKEPYKIAQNPLILRAHRLMDAFAKSDDERDFYLDRCEGFIIFVDLNKSQHELDALETEISSNKNRYILLPKLTFYEIKKIMEGFVNEKVYDIDTKEKLLDVIQSKDARDNFLEFIYDHLTELEKWQQYYQERSRIRIIEWLRNNGFQFVFEEDLELEKQLIEKLKQNLFEAKVSKDIASARDLLTAKAKTYYSLEALNPRPKRGRPPKQTVKIEVEHQVSLDIYTTVGASLRPFLYIPEITSPSAVIFSSKFDSEEEFLASRNPSKQDTLAKWDLLSNKLASLKDLAGKSVVLESDVSAPAKKIDWSKDDDDDNDDDEANDSSSKSKPKSKTISKASTTKSSVKAVKSETKGVAKKTKTQESAKVSSRKPMGKPLYKDKPAGKKS
jgi:hypothetical protein